MDTSKRSHEASMILKVVSFFCCCCCFVAVVCVCFDAQGTRANHYTPFDSNTQPQSFFAAFIRANNRHYHVAVEVLLVKIVLMIIFWRLDWSRSSVNCYHYTRHLADLRKSPHFLRSILSCDWKILERI